MKGTRKTGTWRRGALPAVLAAVCVNAMLVLPACFAQRNQRPSPPPRPAPQPHAQPARPPERAPRYEPRVQQRPPQNQARPQQFQSRPQPQTRPAMPAPQPQARPYAPPQGRSPDTAELCAAEFNAARVSGKPIHAPYLAATELQGISAEQRALGPLGFVAE